MTAQGAVFVRSIVGLRKVADLKRCFHSAFNYHLFLVNFVYPACLLASNSLTRGKEDEPSRHQKIIGQRRQVFLSLLHISFILNFRISFSSPSSRTGYISTVFIIFSQFRYLLPCRRQDSHLSSLLISTNTLYSASSPYPFDDSSSLVSRSL